MKALASPEPRLACVRCVTSGRWLAVGPGSSLETPDWKSRPAKRDLGAYGRRGASLRAGGRVAGLAPVGAGLSSASQPRQASSGFWPQARREALSRGPPPAALELQACGSLRPASGRRGCVYSSRPRPPSPGCCAATAFAWRHGHLS
jgi:hypothetical protein